MPVTRGAAQPSTPLTKKNPNPRQEFPYHHDGKETAMTKKSDDVMEALKIIDANIARTAERMTMAQRSLDRYRSEYAGLIAVRTLVDRIK